MGNIPGAGGTTTSFSNTPQAKDDVFSHTEDFFGITYFDVMGNDLGGNAKTLFSIDNGTNQSGAMSGYSAGDLLTQDSTRTEAASLDKSAKGAKIWISADGKVGYDAATLDPGFKALVQGLHTGQTLTDTFIYAIQLGNGTLSWATVTVTFLGAEDGATISIVAGGDYCVTEAGGTANAVPGDPVASGQLAISDVDAGDNKFKVPLPTALNGTYGTWTFNNITGQWTYTLDNSRVATQALNAGDVTTESLTVTSWDGSANSTITVQVKGSSDDPVALDDTGSGNEDTPILGTVATNDSDVDDGATLSYAADDTAPGFAMGSDGSWTLDATNAAYQHLAAGVTTDVVIGYTVTDEHGDTDSATLTITVTGTNDDPVALDDTGSGNEDTPILGTVATNDSDVDDGATLSYAADDTAPGFAMGSDGSWTLDATNAAYQHLAAGVTTDVVIGYTVTDEHGDTDSATLTITVTGTNDDPVALDDTGSGNEDTPILGTVATNDSDVDDGATLSYAADDTAPGFAMGSDGSWTLDATNAAYQHLAAGVTTDVVIGYTVTDEHGDTDSATLTITVTGTNDDPVALDDTGSGNEDTPILGTVATNDSDVDDGATLSYAADDTAPGFAMGSDGSWTLDATNAAYQHLAAGVTTDVVIGYTVTDEHGDTDSATLTITVTGTDDQPTLAAVSSGSIAEIDQSASRTTAGLTGTLIGNDVDDGDTIAYGILGGGPAGPNLVSLAGVHGTLTVNTVTGAYTYAPTASTIEALDAGENPSDVFTLTVSDGDGPNINQTYTVNLTGADDAPTLAPVASGLIAEVNQSSSTTSAGLTGTLVGNDVDVETLTYGISGGSASGVSQVSLAGTYGTLTVSTLTGAYSYAPNAGAIEGLDVGENPSDVFTVTVSDGDVPLGTQTYTVNLTGADDTPSLAPVTSGSVAEVPNSTSTTDSGLSGTLVGADVDSETLTYGITGGSSSGVNLVSLAGTYGTLTVNTATGAYSYAKNTVAIEALNAGQNPSDVFAVTATDGDGPLASQTYTVNITGANDGPVGLAPTDIKFSLNEANAQAQSGNQLNANTALGTFTALDPDSSAWTFTLAGIGASSFALSPASGLQSSVSLLVGGTSVTSGDYILDLTATDSNGNSKLEIFTVHVGTTGSDSFTITAGTEIDFGLNGTDTIGGGAGDDALVGGQNDDTLDGGLGADELLGGGNKDNFDFIKVGADGNISHYGIDRILDMNDGDDTIRLDDALFVGIGGPGSLNASVLSLTGAPVDANDRIIYNSATGALFYDADGNGASLAVQFAQFDAGTVLAVADFLVI